MLFGLALSGCATSQSNSSLLSRLDPATTESTSPIADGAPKAAATARDYWAMAYAKNPHDERAAISFAHALKADGSKDKALSILEQAAFYNPDSIGIAGEEGRLALDLGQQDLAEKLLNRANDPAHPDWRLLNALGALQAQRNDMAGAQAYFEKAARLAPNDPGVLNNLALTNVLSGDREKAEGLLRRAAAAGGDTARIRQNLALVLGLEGKFDEAQELTSADLGKDKAAANRAYLQMLVEATPVKLGRGAKPDAITGAWQTAVETPQHPGQGKPEDPVGSPWVIDVAQANPPAASAPGSTATKKLAAAE